MSVEYKVRFDEMSFCRLSTRREEAKKEFQTPIINLNKARSFEEGDDD